MKKTKRGRGQPTKIDNPDLVETVVNFIKAGNYLNTACEAAGISHQTYYNWKARAEEGLASGRTDKYVEFFERIKKAEKEAEAFLVANIKNAAVKKNVWQAAAFLLERKYPERWGRKDRQEVTGNIGIDLTGLSDEQLKERLLEMQTRIGKLIPAPTDNED